MGFSRTFAENVFSDMKLKRLTLVQVKPELVASTKAFVRKSMYLHAALVDASHSRALSAHARMLRHILFRRYSEFVTTKVADVVFTRLRRLTSHVTARNPADARAQLDVHYGQARASMLTTGE
jgi:DNA-binding FadR family transcriptional regulator